MMNDHGQNPLRRPSNRFLRTSLAVRNVNMVVRPSVAATPKWALQNPETEDARSSALQGRLEEILIMELHRDGARDFLQLSVRGLYKHVMAAITAPYHTTMPLKNNPNLPPVIDSARDPFGRVSFDEKVLVQPHPPLTNMGREKSHSVPHDDITYKERVGGYLHPRDMRRLVTPFSASNEPELIVRRHVMLLNFDPLRAVILRDRLLVLVPHGADSLLSKLEHRVRGGAMEVENSVFGTASEVDNDDDDVAVSSNRSEQDPDERPASETSHHGTSIIPTLFTKTSNASNSNHSDKGDKKGSVTGPVPKKGHCEMDAAELVSKITMSMEQGFAKNSKTSSKHDSDPTQDEDDSSVNSEWAEMNTRNWIDLPFELQCADAVLNVVCSILQEDSFDLQEEALNYIDCVVTGNFRIGDDPISGLRHTKDAIREMSSRIKGFVQSMNRILDDDEDMALMNLSRLLTHPERYIKPVSPEILEEEADEPELILEAHMQVGLTLMNALDLIQGQVDSASDLVDQKLDSVRNRILFANMIISIFSLCVASAAVVGSLFGMNVPVPHRDDTTTVAFYVITFATVGGALLAAVLILATLFYTQAVPLPGMRG